MTSSLFTLIPVVVILVSFGVLALMVMIAKKADTGLDDDHESDHDEHDAHPFEILGATPLFYVAVGAALGATWWFRTSFFPTWNVWFKMGLVFLFLLLVWPPLWVKIQKVWAGVRGKHFHEHVSHGDDEQDTFGKILFWACSLWGMSVLISVMDHCNVGARCSIGQNFWMQIVLASERFAQAPAVWIFVFALAFQSRITENKLFGYSLFILWVIFGMTYVDGGYNTHPFLLIWRETGGHPPGWLQWLFPVTRG